MTNEEIIKCLDDARGNSEAIHLAEKAVEKQIPKRPVHDARFVPFLCPDCKDFVFEGERYCSRCGQALDWGNNK